MNKIAFFINSLERGGAERVTVRLADFFTQNEIKCYIITNKCGNNEYPLPEGVERFSLSNRKSILNIFRLRKFLKSRAIDSLVVMGTSECVIAIPATRGLKIRTIVSERNDPSNYSGNKLVIMLSRWLMKSADDFVFQTDGAKKFYEKMLKGKGKVIFNPIISSEIPPPWNGSRTNKIVAVGRLEPQKNHLLLIEAFAEISSRFFDVQLEIYGNGSMRSILDSKIDALKLNDKITLHNNTPDVLSLIRSARAFVLPSNFEGMPNALIEAMCLGLPCISTDCPCGGPSALIRNHENGILVPCNDKSALVAALQFVISHPDISNEYGKRAEEVKKILDISAVGNQWIEVILTDKSK